MFSATTITKTDCGFSTQALLFYLLGATIADKSNDMKDTARQNKTFSLQPCIKCDSKLGRQNNQRTETRNLEGRASFTTRYRFQYGSVDL